jgi:competence protein ComEA
LEELKSLPGVGDKTAQAILDYRAANGPFRDVKDLLKVKGIGPKKLEKMAPMVEVSP